MPALLLLSDFELRPFLRWKKIPRTETNSYYKSPLLIRYRTKEKDAVSFSPHVCIKIGI